MESKIAMAVETKNEKKAKPAGTGKKPVKSLFEEEPKRDELTQLVHDIQQRPLLYAGIVVFLLVCLLSGFLYSAYDKSSRAELVTAYAKALDKTEPAERLAALEPLAQGSGKGVDEVLYVTGETAYAAGQYDKAKAAFERLRKEFPDSQNVPDAVEGLGYIAQNAKDYDGALALYTEVKDKWPKSYAARRQPLNIAKLEESRGKLKEAVAAFREQLTVFPGSSLAAESSASLARLEKTNPDLFPKVEAPAAPVAAPGATAPAAGASEAMPELNLKLDAPAKTPTPADQPATPAAETAPAADAAAPASEPAPAAAPAAEPAPAAAPSAEPAPAAAESAPAAK